MDCRRVRRCTSRRSFAVSATRRSRACERCGPFPLDCGLLTLRILWTCNAGRAGTRLRSEALRPTLPSDQSCGGSRGSASLPARWTCYDGRAGTQTTYAPFLVLARVETSPCAFKFDFLNL